MTTADAVFSITGAFFAGVIIGYLLRRQRLLLKISNGIIQNSLYIKNMANEFTELTEQVAESNTVMASAATLIRGFGAKLDEIIANGNKPEDIAALKDSLKAAEDDLSAAVAENTPGE